MTASTSKNVDSPQKREPEDRIITRVREAWNAADSDMPAAVNALYTDIAGRPVLLNEIMPQILRSWCREQIGEYVGKLRLSSIQPITDPSQGGRLRTAFAATLFDFPLPGGKRLGDANAREIKDGAQAYSQTADDAAHKARWLSRVSEVVGRKNRAENALTLDQLTNLFEEARNG